MSNIKGSEGNVDTLSESELREMVGPAVQRNKALLSLKLQASAIEWAFVYQQAKLESVARVRQQARANWRPKGSVNGSAC